jgi:carbon starvation protein CstA
MFVVTAAILVYSISDAKGFQVIWRYFAWANQVLATVTLWTISVYLAKNKGKLWYLITLIPALFMTMVTGCFLFVAKAADGGLADWILSVLEKFFGEELGATLSLYVEYGIGAAITVLGLVLFLVFLKKNKAKA